MKKILALALAIVLAFAIAVPVFATNEITDHVDVDAVNPGTFDTQTGTSDVTYNVDGNYIITIPATITLAFVGVDTHVQSTPLQVKADKVLIPFGKELRVNIESNNKLEYKVGNDVKDYITFDICNATSAELGNTVLQNGIVLIVNEGGVNTDAGDQTQRGSAVEEIYFGVKTTTVPKYNGQYDGIITFTANVVDTADEYVPAIPAPAAPN